MDKKSRGAAELCLKTKINQTSKLFPNFTGKKIRCKLSLRAAQTLGAARRRQKTVLCKIPKAFAFLQKEKTN